MRADDDNGMDLGAVASGGGEDHGADAGIVREIARWVKGIGWTRAARPVDAAPCNARAQVGPKTHPGGTVTGEGNGTNKGKVKR